METPTVDKITPQFEAWYEQNKPPAGAVSELMQDAFKILAKHAYLEGFISGMSWVADKMA